MRNLKVAATKTEKKVRNMHKYSYKNGGVYVWFLQRLTGFLLLALLLVHMLVEHFTLGGHELSYALVAKRVATPLWKIIDSLFLIMGTFHGLNGVWMIASDYIKKDWLKVAVVSVLLCLGGVLLTLGLLTVIPFKM